MPELSDVLGAILRDIAKARVISDLFSRDISREYEADQILVEFPVPRVEIREASVQLRFAVDSVTEPEVDVASIVQRRIAELAAGVGREGFATLILASPKREEYLELMQAEGIDLEQSLTKGAAKVANSSRQDVLAAVQGAPDKLVARLVGPLEEVLRSIEVIWEALKRERRVAEIQEALKSATAAAVVHFAQDVKAEVEKARAEGLRVNVVVTGPQLAEVPESGVSHVNVVTEIRNYEWEEVAENDEVIRRLKPE
jgi:hypothetical protein